MLCVKLYTERVGVVLIMLFFKGRILYVMDVLKTFYERPYEDHVAQPNHRTAAYISSKRRCKKIVF